MDGAIAKSESVVILGADGMLGNAVFKYLKSKGLGVVGTSRKKIFGQHYFLDAENFTEKSMRELVQYCHPSYAVNCIGYIRPKDQGLQELKKTLAINAVFPQKLSLGCSDYGIRLIHFSTDCVFSGAAGPYRDTVIPDEMGSYGLSKFLGEVRRAPHVTIRTSLIGRELSGHRNLLDWFLATDVLEINGYKNVLWNGISTVTAAKIVEAIIARGIMFEHPIIQVGSEVIDKFKLLCLFKEIFKKNIVIKSDLSIKSNKVLVPSIEQKIFFEDLIPSLKEQVIELKSFYG